MGDVSRQAQYLCTAVWKTDSQPAIKRDRLLQSAIDMYHTLNISLPPLLHLDGDVLIPNIGNMQEMPDWDMSGIVVPSFSSHGFDDDLAAEDDLAADDDIAAEDNIAEESSEERPKLGLGLKIASFANN